MPRSFSGTARILARPGAVIVAAPREVACDELRLARLEDFLRCRFPDLDVTVTDRLAGPAGSGFVGASAEAQTPNRAAIAEIAEAVREFTDYGERRH